MSNFFSFQFPHDIISIIAQYLDIVDCIKFLVTCKYLYTAAKNIKIWNNCLSNVSQDVLRPLLCLHNISRECMDTKLWFDVLRDIDALNKCKICHWREVHYESQIDTFSDQEAHAAILLDSMHLVVTKGWGSVEDYIEVFDVSLIPQVKRLPSIVTGDVGGFKYGSTLVKLSENQLLQFGGLSNGGYRDAISGNHIMLSTECCMHNIVLLLFLL